MILLVDGTLSCLSDRSHPHASQQSKKNKYSQGSLRDQSSGQRICTSAIAWNQMERKLVPE